MGWGQGPYVTHGLWLPPAGSWLSFVGISLLVSTARHQLGWLDLPHQTKRPRTQYVRTCNGLPTPKARIKAKPRPENKVGYFFLLMKLMNVLYESSIFDLCSYTYKCLLLVDMTYSFLKFFFIIECFIWIRHFWFMQLYN